MRIVFNILLFLLPFAAFFLYARYANAKRARAGHDPLETPWFWLVAIALVLAIAGFFVPIPAPMCRRGSGRTAS